MCIEAEEHQVVIRASPAEEVSRYSKVPHGVSLEHTD